MATIARNMTIDQATGLVKLALEHGASSIHVQAHLGGDLYFASILYSEAKGPLLNAIGRFLLENNLVV